jgi:hypothetical protein
MTKSIKSLEASEAFLQIFSLFRRKSALNKNNLVKEL